MPSSRVITIVIVLLIGYVLGARMPGIAQRIGVA